MKTPFGVQETDDRHQETSLISSPCESTDSNDSSEGVLVDNDPRMIMLFGMNIVITDSRSTNHIDDDGDQEKKISKGKETIIVISEEKKKKKKAESSLNKRKFFDEQKSLLPPTMLPPKKRPFSVQETDDGSQETSLSSSYSSTDGYQQKKRISIDSSEGVRVDNNPRISKLFGDDDGDQEKKISKGKEKIVDICEEKKKKKGESSSNKRKSKKSNVHREEKKPSTPLVPPLFHPRILQEIQQHGGSEQPVFLFEKKLETSDVKSDQNRVFITRSEKLMGFLTAEERRKVESDEKDKLKVLTIDPEGEVYKLNLRWWKGVRMVVLNHEWRKLVNANRLQKGDSVQGWGYRTSDEFRLAMIIVKNS